MTFTHIDQVLLLFYTVTGVMGIFITLLVIFSKKSK